MKALRRTAIGGLAGLGLVGVLAAGVGVASAATTPTPSAPNGGTGRHAPMGGMMDGMMGDHMPGHTVLITAAATYLGMSQEDLQAQLSAGTSLADVAKARGKSVEGLQDAIVTAMTARINSNTTLTEAQKTAMLAMVKKHVAAMVTQSHPAGGGCPMGGAGARAMMGTGVA